MNTQLLYNTYQRFRTLQSNVITALPIVILMPHSACNCRCVMCDIWKGNKNLKQLTEDDIKELLSTLRKYKTKQVLMSGGEALLNASFFQLCKLLKKEKISITLLSTGLLLKQNAVSLLEYINDIIVSLDGDEKLHDIIRNIPGAYLKLKEGVSYIKSIEPTFRISARTVIHKLNYKSWPAIIECAKDIGLDQISFLPADITSTAFNRQTEWGKERKDEVMLQEEELPELRNIIYQLIADYQNEFENGFIAETPDKILKIYTYYGALNGLNPFPYKKCNAPWVSTVIEADGAVKPCFFHPEIGNIKKDSLEKILNSEKARQFRRALDIETNEICKRCVCSLYLPPHSNLLNC
jgi:MoaA/NifB/PqqE/SkfB family radical SAM enzyme